jgi:hypothetical protein
VVTSVDGVHVRDGSTTPTLQADHGSADADGRPGLGRFNPNGWVVVHPGFSLLHTAFYVRSSGGFPNADLDQIYADLAGYL